MPAPFAVSYVVSTLEAVWRRITDNHPDLPRAVIVVASGTEATKIRRHGHYGASRWTVEKGERVAEVLIAGERLADGAAMVLETLLHEAAHAIADARKIEDTSRGGRYHNARYKALAESVGLTVEKDRVYGWTLTDLAPGTAEAYRAELGALEVAINGYRHAAGGDGDGGRDKEKSKGRALFVCGCAEPRKLRVSPKVAAQGPIVCGLCGEEFAAEDGDAAEDGEAAAG